MLTPNKCEGFGNAVANSGCLLVSRGSSEAECSTSLPCWREDLRGKLSLEVSNTLEHIGKSDSFLGSTFSSLGKIGLWNPRAAGSHENYDYGTLKILDGSQFGNECHRGPKHFLGCSYRAVFLSVVGADPKGCPTEPKRELSHVSQYVHNRF